MLCCSKEAAGTKTAKLKDEKEVLDRQLRAADEACKNLHENLQELKSREVELSSQEEQLKTKLKKVNEAISKHNEEISRANKELKEKQIGISSARSVVFALEMFYTMIYLLGQLVYLFCTLFVSSVDHRKGRVSGGQV